MNKMLSWVFTVVALFLLGLGYLEYQSTASEISRLMTGAPTDETVWLVIGGLVSAITAAFGFANDQPRQTQTSRAG